MQEIILDNTLDGLRFDACLKKFYPDLGLRAARRMILAKQVLLNNKYVLPAKKVRAGDVVSVVDCHRPAWESLYDGIRILASQDGYYFLTKPKGIHTVKLKGASTPSVEDILPVLFKDCRPILLQRLDFATSGILTLGATARECQTFRDFETQGVIEKKYLAVVEGIICQRIVAKQRLDTSHKLVRFEEELGDSLRYTIFEPFLVFKHGELIPEWLHLPFKRTPIDVSLVGCIIKKGLRHQIRVHAKSIAHNLLFDFQYGASRFDCGNVSLTDFSFYLHHAAIFFPNFTVANWPTWLTQNSELQHLAEWLTVQS